MPRQVSGECDRTWIGRSMGAPGFTRSYSMPTSPANLVPFETPVPLNIHACGEAMTIAALTGFDSYSVPVSEDSGSGCGGSRQSLVTRALFFPYIGSRG